MIIGMGSDLCNIERIQAARDRGRGIDPVDRPRRELDEAIQQQRVMRAGQHDGVGAGA